MSKPTRDRILDAALRAFATRGVDGTPITDLEDAAGLAAGSGGFYRYFRTKDEVLTAVVHREIERVRAQHEGNLDAAAVDPTDARATVTATLEEGLDTLRSLGPLMAILSREQGRIPELAAEVADRLLEGGLRDDATRIEELLDTDPASAQRLMAVITSSLVGYTLATAYFGSPPGGVDRDAFVATLTDLVAPRT